MDIPFDGIITLLLFLIGLPVFVWQFKDSDVRNVVLRHSILRWGIPSLIFLSLAGTGAALFLWFRIKPQDGQLYWVLVCAGLLTLTVFYALLIYYFSDRQRAILSLKRHIEARIRRGLRVDEALGDLIDLGKKSQPGAHRNIVLMALFDATMAICRSRRHWGILEAVIDETVVMMTSSPERDDLENIRVAIDLLAGVANSEEIEEDKYRQHAVRALSLLGQRILVDFRQSDRTDDVMIAMIGLLALSTLSLPALATDVSQTLFEIGQTAVQETQPFIADTALEKLITLGETNRPARDELAADILGLTALFWTGGKSMREHLDSGNKMKRVEECVASPFQNAVASARKHFLGKADFEVADKLAAMATRRDDNRHESLTQ